MAGVSDMAVTRFSASSITSTGKKFRNLRNYGAPTTVEYLVIAGGGGGGSTDSGDGGAGGSGIVIIKYTVTPATTRYSTAVTPVGQVHEPDALNC